MQSVDPSEFFRIDSSIRTRLDSRLVPSGSLNQLNKVPKTSQHVNSQIQEMDYISSSSCLPFSRRCSISNMYSSNQSIPPWTRLKRSHRPLSVISRVEIPYAHAFAPLRPSESALGRLDECGASRKGLSGGEYVVVGMCRTCRRVESRNGSSCGRVEVVHVIWQTPQQRAKK
jgi:hypothetical protein